MLAEKEALLVAGLEEFGRSELVEEATSPRAAQPCFYEGPYEASLVARLRAGEMGAFDQLVEEYQSLVFALALRILNDAEDARDVTQETFLKVYRHFASFRGDSSLKTWICRIAINQARSAERWFRRRHRHGTASLEAPLGLKDDDERSPIDFLQSQCATPEDETLSRERGRQIEAGLRLMKKDFRIAVILRDIEGLSYEEIAWATEVSVGTVKSRIARGREMLRQIVLSGERS